MSSRLTQLQIERLSGEELLDQGLGVAVAANPQPEEQWVYFIEAEGTGLVKVGYATNAARRIASLATASPVSLTVLGTTPGGRQREAEFHLLLEDYRHHGEWFRRSPFMDAIIATLDRPADLLAAAGKRQEYLMAYLDKHYRKEGPL